ncbi:hypothetical protein [Pseudotamlana carrageenivorans]|uniref:Uncharacterized protein n=1 Tax=Pseudotamlana carrageenivorans TaxID=2069432 RepID=A0A2I7SET5_9FLAO|nr:hypothetical protein [Tamlana carrageenivorans]AUS04394.1 hypothetical protein C1A40_02405 [Tamlana carrageenivorans]
MNQTIITYITAIGGSTLLSSFVTHFITKRKYNIEADGIEIRNLKESIGAYQEIISDLRKHVDYLEKQQIQMREEFNTRLSEINSKGFLTNR